MNKLFGIENYIELYVSKSTSYTDEYELMPQVLRFIADQNSPQLLFIQGLSGGGKSLYLIQLMRKLNTLIKEG